MSTEEKLDLRQTAYILANNIHGDTSKAEEIYQFLARAFDEKTECEESPPSKAKEIDWDRPQLVKCSVHNNELIVRTIGKHHGLLFAGVAITNPNKSVREYFKEDFVYCGEIRPKKCANDTGVDCTPDFCICANPTEKTTGLNFLEMVKLIKEDRDMRGFRPLAKRAAMVLYVSVNRIYQEGGSLPEFVTNDIFEQDWQVDHKYSIPVEILNALEVNNC